MANFALVSSYLFLHEINDLQVQIVENNILYMVSDDLGMVWLSDEANTAYSALTACLTPVMRIVCMTTGNGGMDTVQVRVYTAQNTPSNWGGGGGRVGAFCGQWPQPTNKGGLV
jgi:hypothetical protein